MRHPPPDGRKRVSERSRGVGGVLLVLSIFGVVVAASYPLVVGAFCVGALSSYLYRRVRRIAAGRDRSAGTVTSEECKTP